MGSRRLVSNIDDVVKIASHLSKYNYNIDYSISCIDDNSIIDIDNPVLEKKLGSNKLFIKSFFPVESKHICISSRIYDLDNIFYEEIEPYIVVVKLFSCIHRFKAFIFLNNKTQLFYEIVYVLRELDKKWGLRPDLTVLSGLVDTLFKYKEIYNRIKDLEKILRNNYSEKYYEEYLDKVNELDKILPILKDLWINHRELFDKVNEAVLSTEYDGRGVRDYINNNYNEYREYILYVENKWFNLVNDIAETYGVKPTILFIDRIVGDETDDKELFLKTYGFLKKLGCSTIYFIDGEEYIVLKTMLGLDIGVAILESS